MTYNQGSSLTWDRRSTPPRKRPFRGSQNRIGTYTDQELDKETGLYNYNARLYDPAVGIFISPDSIVPNVYDPQSLNPYAYCLNNPLKYKDPSGHFIVSGTIAVGYAAYASYALGTALASGIAYYAVPIAADIGKKLNQLVHEARKTKSKDKRAADKERTQEQKDEREHFGDMGEAHQDQKNQGAQDLGDKLNGIRNEYPDNPARRTEENMRKKMLDEAQDALKNSTTNNEQQEQQSESDGEDGKSEQDGDEESEN